MVDKIEFVNGSTIVAIPAGDVVRGVKRNIATTKEFYEKYFPNKVDPDDLTQYYDDPELLGKKMAELTMRKAIEKVFGKRNEQ